MSRLEGWGLSILLRRALESAAEGRTLEPFLVFILHLHSSLKSLQVSTALQPPTGCCLGFSDGPVLGSPGNYTSQQTQRQLSRREDREMPRGPLGGGKTLRLRRRSTEIKV